MTKSDSTSESRRTTTREILGTIASTLQVADLIALLMVFVAAMSAYATWKTTQITKEILLTSQRPYIGTQSINLIAATSPRLVVELRNFGSVQAEHAMISVLLIVNGKALATDCEPQRQQSPVILSPGVPHRFYRHLSTDIYRDAVQGKVDLAVEIEVRYRGPRGDEHCYLTHDSFDPIDAVFYPQRGSLSCDQTAPPV